MPDEGTKVRQRAKATEFAVEASEFEYNIFFKKIEEKQMIYGCYTQGRTWFSGKRAALVIQ